MGNGKCENEKYGIVEKGILYIILIYKLFITININFPIIFLEIIINTILLGYFYAYAFMCT